jgi:hypothetical protein
MKNIALKSKRLILTQNGFGMKVQPDGAAADAKLRAILEKGRPHTLVLEKGAVGGIEILQIHGMIANLEDAMVPGDLRVVQRQIGALAADNGTGIVEKEGLALGGPSGDGKDDVGVERELQAIVNGGQAKVRGGSVGAGERRHGRYHHGLIDTMLDFHDGGQAAAGTAELHLSVVGHDLVLQ